MNDSAKPRVAPGDRYCEALLFLFYSAAYLCFPTRDYVFEGLARSMPVELGLWSGVLRGNYLLYGCLGNIFHSALRSFGFPVIAVHSLQAMDALLGATGLLIFFRILRQLGIDRGLAFMWAGILGASFGYWRWSTDAENYILVAFLLQLNFLFLLLYGDGRGTPVRLGILHALAIFGHIVNCIFAPVVIWFIVSRHGGAWRRPVLKYALTAIATVVIVYGIVLIWVIKPEDEIKAWFWLIGSAKGGAGGVRWHGGWSLLGLFQWLRMTLHIFTSFQPEFRSPAGWRASGAALWTARLFLALCAAAAIRGAFRSFADGAPEGNKKRSAVVGCCIWLLAYAVMFTSWEPYTMVYRVADIAPFCLLLCLGVDSIFSRKNGLPSLAAYGACGRAAIPAILWGALGLGNFGAEIYPSSYGSNNPDLLRMAFLKANTAEGDWIAGEGGRDELYIPFFAVRRPLLVGRFDDVQLIRRVDGLMSLQQNVYVTSRILGNPHWDKFFGRFRPTMTATDGSGFALYRLTRKA